MQRVRVAFGTVIPASGGSAPRPQILGWQELTLNLNAVCEQCNEIMPKGTQAAAAIYDVPGPRAFLCSGCLEKLGHDDKPDSD